MMYLLVFAGICGVWSIFYIWTEYNWKPKQFFWTKGLNSLLFVSIGILGVVKNSAPKGYAVFILFALIFGLIGDLFLVFPNSPKLFKAGLSSFLVGQIIYGTAFLRLGGFLFFDVLIYCAAIIGLLIAYMKTKLELGKMKIPVLLYALIITYMFTMAISLLYKGGVEMMPLVFISAGACLFYASDGVLAYNKFGKNPSRILRGLNLALYYTGQVLLALSISAF